MALCCSVKSPLSCPISWMTDAFVLLSLHAIPSKLLHIHISHASILSSNAFVFVHVSHPYNTIGKIIDFTKPAFVSILTCLSLHIFPIPCIADFPSIILRLTSVSHLPLFLSLSPETRNTLRPVFLLRLSRKFPILLLS